MTNTVTRAIRGGSPKGGLLRPRRRLAGIAITIALIGGWWMFLAPSNVGGRTTFAEVIGHSMEPKLHTGDLSMSRAQSKYSLGDLVVFKVHLHDGNGYVIHRLVGGSDKTGWKTKGDNHNWVDPWTIPTANIAGRYWFEVPQFGTAMAWVRTNPLLFAAICSASAMLFYLPLRRRRIAPALALVLETASKEPRSQGRSSHEYGVLILSSIATLASAAAVARLAASHHLASPSGVVITVALVWAGACTLYLLNRLFDGRGVAEPAKSAYALSGRLYLVESLAGLDQEADRVRSAVALRSIAERERLPVLHTVDTASGHEEYLVMTDGRGSYRWDVVVPTSLPERVPVDPIPVPSLTPFRHSHADSSGRHRGLPSVHVTSRRHIQWWWPSSGRSGSHTPNRRRTSANGRGASAK